MAVDLNPESPAAARRRARPRRGSSWAGRSAAAGGATMPRTRSANSGRFDAPRSSGGSYPGWTWRQEVRLTGNDGGVEGVEDLAEGREAPEEARHSDGQNSQHRAVMDEAKKTL